VADDTTLLRMDTVLYSTYHAWYSTEQVGGASQKRTAKRLTFTTPQIEESTLRAPAGALLDNCDSPSRSTDTHAWPVD
jgi:hypothetical protein